MRPMIAALAVLIVLASFVMWPRGDLIVSGWFYRPGTGFFLRDQWIFEILHNVAYAGARILGIALGLLAILTAIRRKPTLGVGTKAWLFLFLGLLLGPGLVANVILKDHWGRARPREIVEFGGASHFSPALIPADECRSNCSFISGDGAFGFYLPAFAYVVPPSRSRRAFWGGMALGTLFAFARLAAGAHFLSDNLYAAVCMQGVLAALHGAMFGLEKTRKCWLNWMFIREKSTG